MPWSTPKTDWATDDAVGTTDFNRIENNTVAAIYETGHGVAPESITSANNLDITTTNNMFSITGNTEIHYIKTTGRRAGSAIFLMLVNHPTLKHNQSSAPANYAKIVSFEGDIGTYDGEILQLLFDGTQWRTVGVYL